MKADRFRWSMLCIGAWYGFLCMLIIQSNAFFVTITANVVFGHVGRLQHSPPTRAPPRGAGPHSCSTHSPAHLDGWMKKCLCPQKFSDTGSYRAHGKWGMQGWVSVSREEYTRELALNVCPTQVPTHTADPTSKFWKSIAWMRLVPELRSPITANDVI